MFKRLIVLSVVLVAAIAATGAAAESGDPGVVNINTCLLYTSDAADDLYTV